MSKVYKRQSVAGLFSVLLLGLVILIPVETAEAQQTRRVQTLPQKVYDQLIKTQELIEEKRHSDAKVVLDRLRSQQAEFNNYTRAQIANFTGFYYYDLGNYRSALSEYRKVIKDPTGIPEGVYNQTFYTIAQLYFQLEDYKSALKYAQRWFDATPEPPADAYILIAQAHYALRAYNKALPLLKKGIKMYTDEGRKPKENWLVLLRGIYYEKNDNKNMFPVVQQLVELYPRRQYLLALAGLYSEFGRRDKMTAVLEAVYEMELLKGKGKQMVNLANLYMLQEVPYKAAKVLDREMKSGQIKKTEKNYRLLAQAFMLSKEFEKALAPMSQAARTSSDPNRYNELGQSYIALDKWSEAEKALRTALDRDAAERSNKEKKDKKVLKRPDQTRLSLGLTLVEQKKFDEAQRLFQTVLANDPESEAASRWIDYVKAEKRRIEQLEAPIVINVNVDF